MPAITGTSMSEEPDKTSKPASVEQQPAAAQVSTSPEPDPGERRWFIGWGTVAIFGTVLAVAANLSEILGWFTPNETRDLVEETRSTMQQTDEKVSELISLLINQAAASGVNLDIDSEDAIRNAVEAIIVSGDRQKRAALDKVVDGDIAGAAESLERLATTQAEAVSATSSSAAATWAEAAAVYESIDVEKAADSDERAAELAPGNAKLLEQAGRALFTAGRVNAAEVRFRQALTLGPDAATRSASLRGLGHIEQLRANYTGADANFRLALDVADEESADAERIYALRSLGQLARSRGDMDSAMRLLEQALTYANAYGDERLRAFVLTTLGTTDAENGDYGSAEARLNEALAIYE